ncbi:MAG TPA: F0F1 ATP synthase subunit alpha [Clostridiales bacterium]|nr:F0F1 ATP synthase subunit alpha [Clostridiales bacterium]
MEDMAVMTVSSAIPLEQHQLDRIRDKYRGDTPADRIILKHILEPALLAGFKVSFGGKTYDFTVKGRLESIRRKASGMSRMEEVLDQDAPFNWLENMDFSMDRAEQEAKLQAQGEEEIPADAGVEQMGEIFRSKIEGLAFGPVLREEGTVRKSYDGIAQVSGLEGCMAGELLEFENNVYGMALNLETDYIGSVLFGNERNVVEGSAVRRTGRPVEVPAGSAVLSRVLDPLGRPLDGKARIKPEAFRSIENPAPSILDRKMVDKPLQTGIMAIDAMVPIGKGQRELIIGDRQTGKTAICLDAIINQKDKDVICVYVSIGQKASTVASVVDTLERFGAMEYTVIIASNASDAPALQYIAPYSGCALAEYFMLDLHKDVLIVYDDLSKHAVAYRTMSLLLKRPPGREAYPGDVFYLHARLLERAAALNDERGGGTMTAIPVIETVAGDLSAYIPTNVISITDGQIYLESDLFFSGQRPAVNVGLSVSRVGGTAQRKAMRKVAASLRIDLAQYREMSVFAQFGSDLDKVTRDRLKQGERLVETLKQQQYAPMAMEEQVAVLYAAVNGYLMPYPVQMVSRFNQGFVKFVRDKRPEIFRSIAETGELTGTAIQMLDNALEAYQKVAGYV